MISYLSLRSIRNNLQLSVNMTRTVWAPIPTYPSRGLAAFSTSGSSNPNGNWQYFQGLGGAFPSANATLSIGSYTSNYTISGNVFSIANGGGGWTGRTGYPTTIFQTDGIAFSGKFFVFGGNGLNGSPSGGSTAAVYYLNSTMTSWTAGTTLPASGSWAAGTAASLSGNKIYVERSGNAYVGDGTTAWVSATAAPGTKPATMNVSGTSWSITTTATYYSSNNAASWVNAAITPPITSSLPDAVVGPTDNNTPTSIYLFWNTYSTPAGYYFNGSTFTSTNNFGTQNNNYESGGANSYYASGINGNQITFIMNNGGYRYATINA